MISGGGMNIREMIVWADGMVKLNDPDCRTLCSPKKRVASTFCTDSAARAAGMRLYYVAPHPPIGVPFLDKLPHKDYVLGLPESAIEVLSSRLTADQT